MRRSFFQTFGGEGMLVQRGHGRIYRTEAGDLFLRYCESMLSVATEACKALQDYRCALSCTRMHRLSCLLRSCCARLGTGA